MNKFIMLIGPSGAGKSSLAKVLLEENGGEEICDIVSSDAVRAVMFGDESIQDNPQEVFKEVHKLILESKKDVVIMDSTNLTIKNRRKILEKIGSAHRIAYVVCEDFDTLVARQQLRDRKVPVEVIKRQIQSFQMPLYTEFDEIYNIISENQIEVDDVLKLMIGVDQKNPHHQFTLGQHCLLAMDFIKQYDTSGLLPLVAMLHDMGKLYSYQDDEEKGIRHYYSHENVGAYYSLLIDFKDMASNIEVAQLINYHMIPYFINSEKVLNKWTKILGPKLMNQINLIHNADVAAH